MALHKSINKFTLLASAIAGIVGSGWLLGPLVSAKIAGPAAILTWVIAGILMMIVAATFVRLARTYPIVGGSVRYFQLNYGHFAGFSLSWIAWLAWVAVSPIETMALLQYSGNYIPGLMTSGPEAVLTPFGIFLAMILMVLMTCINCYGVKTYSKFNNIILAFKILVPLITVILLLSTHFNLGNFYNSGGFMPHGIQSIFSALPMAGVIYSFIGFNPAIQLAAETKNPRKAIPLAIFGSLIICILLYSAVQIAFLGALSPSSLKAGWSHIQFLGDYGPFAGLLSMFGFYWFVKVLYIDATVSPFGTAMVQSMATSRLTYAMSENGYFPKQFLRTNKHNSPARAIIFNTLIGFIFFLPFPSWQKMVGFLVSCLVLGYIVGPMSLLALTHAQENLTKHSRGLMHSFYCIAFYICSLIIYWTGWHTILKLSIVFFSGYVILAIQMMRKSKKISQELNILRGSWVVIYMIGMTIISYFSSFGGSNAIPFGIDFFVMAGFTLFIYCLAYFLIAYTIAPEFSMKALPSVSAS